MCQGGDFTKHNGTGGTFLVFQHVGHSYLGFVYFSSNQNVLTL